MLVCHFLSLHLSFLVCKMRRWVNGPLLGILGVLLWEAIFMRLGMHFHEKSVLTKKNT